MKIQIYLDIPSEYENIEELKKLIGTSKVKAYSLDLDNNSIVEGEGWIESNGSYNYHNNYDDSEDCMYFEGKQQWFSLNYERVVEIQKENSKKILKTLQPIIDKANI
jgi:hypothetical protein